VARADEHAAGALDALVREGEEPRVRLDRVLQRRAVHHDGVGHRPVEAPGEDDRAHHEVVGQRDVGRDPVDHLVHRRDVGVEVAVELPRAEVGERLGLHPFVAVGDVDGEQAVDVGPVGGAADGLAQGAHTEPTVDPLADRVDEVEPLGVALLAEQVDLMPGAAQGRGEVRVVDVRTRPGQQIAVEDQHAHGISRPCGS
jgi:hypothetical protein